MKARLAEWLGKARRLEAAIESRVEGASRRLAPSSREPLETVHAIVTAVAREVQAAGRGHHVFPYSQIRIWPEREDVQDAWLVVHHELRRAARVRVVMDAISAQFAAR